MSSARVHVMLRGQSREARPDLWSPARGRLTMADREEIMLGLDRGKSLRAIARRLERSPSTVSREVVAKGGRQQYRIWPALQPARVCTRRPKSAKLDDPALCEKVTTWLEEFWSPDEISRRLRREFPDDAAMQISHEAIYQSLYVQGRGELRRELTRCLRSGRAQRRSQDQSERHINIPNMVMISERPAEVEDRAVPGRWEGDLIIGAGGKSAVGTLVERSTRFVLLLHLPDDHGAQAVEEAMRRAITTLPSELTRSVTWDREVKWPVTLTSPSPPAFRCSPPTPAAPH